MITKTLPDIPSKFTGVREDAATGETTNNVGYCSPHRRKPQKSQTTQVSPVPSSSYRGSYSHALTTQCSWCWKG